jgi:hypothetical protein
MLKTHPQKNVAGEIDKEVLGKLVFADSELRKKLNSCTHLPIGLQVAWSLFVSWLKFTFIVVRDCAAAVTHHPIGPSRTAHMLYSCTAGIGLPSIV